MLMKILIFTQSLKQIKNLDLYHVFCAPFLALEALRAFVVCSRPFESSSLRRQRLKTQDPRLKGSFREAAEAGKIKYGILWEGGSEI